MATNEVKDTKKDAEKEKEDLIKEVDEAIEEIRQFTGIMASLIFQLDEEQIPIDFVLLADNQLASVVALLQIAKKHLIKEAVCA